MRIVRVGGERRAAVEPGIETATDRMNDVCAPAQDRTVGDVCLDLKMFVLCLPHISHSLTVI